MDYYDTVSGVVEATLLISEQVEHLTTYLSRYPAWTLAFMTELRAVFAKREKYAPDYLMMSFEFSELKTDDEIDILVARHFPGYAGASAKDRRGKLSRKLKRMRVPRTPMDDLADIMHPPLYKGGADRK
jgi:hypothetical protein